VRQTETYSLLCSGEVQMCHNARHDKPATQSTHTHYSQQHATGRGNDGSSSSSSSMLVAGWASLEGRLRMS
jgi:hypothetical protein